MIRAILFYKKFNFYKIQRNEVILMFMLYALIVKYLTLQ